MSRSHRTVKILVVFQEESQRHPPAVALDPKHSHIPFCYDRRQGRCRGQRSSALPSFVSFCGQSTFEIGELLLYLGSLCAVFGQFNLFLRFSKREEGKPNREQTKRLTMTHLLACPRESMASSTPSYILSASSSSCS